MTETILEATLPPSNELPPMGTLVGKLAGAFKHQLSPGEIAQLRRLDFKDPGSPAFWIVMARIIEPNTRPPIGEAERTDFEQRWAVLLQVMASMNGAHAFGSRLGTSLAAAGYSEMRLARLLRAQDDALFDAIQQTGRFLASKAVAIDWTDIANLLFTHSPERAESLRRRIAADYYRTQHQADS